MSGPDCPHPRSVVDAIKNVFDTSPEGEDGVGSTLSPDVDPKASRRNPVSGGARPGGKDPSGSAGGGRSQP